MREVVIVGLLGVLGPARSQCSYRQVDVCDLSALKFALSDINQHPVRWSEEYCPHSHRSQLCHHRLLQHKWSSEGQRVIAVCKRSLDAVKLPKDETELEEVLYSELQELTLIGLISIRDPPRADVKDAVRVIRAAGVRIFMVTGDFMITAVAIAKQVF